MDARDTRRKRQRLAESRGAWNPKQRLEFTLVCAADKTQNRRLHPLSRAVGIIRFRSRFRTFKNLCLLRVPLTIGCLASGSEWAQPQSNETE
jgi:hypothetical protein